MKQVLMNYTCQCTDQVSGQKGCFLYDVAKWKETGLFYAIGPVYDDLVAFYSSPCGEKRESIYESREDN